MCRVHENRRNPHFRWYRESSIIFQLHPPDYWGITPLHVAVKKGHTAIVKLLVLEHNADVNAEDDKGVTPLLLAGSNSTKTFEDIVSVLVQNGADVNKKDYITGTLKTVFCWVK